MKFLAASIVALIGAAGSAQGAIVTQTFNMPVTATDISGVLGTFTFNYFQSSGAPAGSTLTSVQLRLSVTEHMNLLTVANNDPNNQQTFRYLTYSNISMVGTAPAADKAGLKTAIDANGGGVGTNIILKDTGSLVYNPSQTMNFAPPIITVSDDSTLINAAAIAPYNTTGTFTLGFTTLTFQTFFGGGGNGHSDQDTDAIATLTVVYNYTPVPTPGAAAMLGLGGLVAGRRRRA